MDGVDACVSRCVLYVYVDAICMRFSSDVDAGLDMCMIHRIWMSMESHNVDWLCM